MSSPLTGLVVLVAVLLVLAVSGMTEAASDSTCTSGLLGGFPIDFCYQTAALLAVFVGAVAIGSERNARWVRPFAGHLFGTGLRRVRGYLAPIDKPGVQTARPSIGLENPGLEEVIVGAGTPYASYAKETVLRFVGTRDGSPPEVRVEQGVLLLGGKEVEKAGLEDGDLLEIEGLQYVYLRGRRA